MVVGDDERALGGVERQRTRRRRVDTEDPRRSRIRGGSTGSDENTLGEPSGGDEVLQQAIAHEETGGDHDRVAAEAEQLSGSSTAFRYAQAMRRLIIFVLPEPVASWPPSFVQGSR